MKKIRTIEAVCATVNFVCVKIFINEPQAIIRAGKNSSWIIILINTGFTLAAFLLAFYIRKKQQEDLIDACPSFLRPVVGLTVAAYLIITSAFTLLFLLKGVIRNFMPEAPTLFILLFFFIPILIGAKLGIRANIQVGMIFAPILIIIILLAIVLVPYYDYTDLFPILGNNNFYFESLYMFNFFSDFIMFFMLIPYMDNDKVVKRAGICTILISGALYLIFILVDIMVVPFEIEYFSPFYEMISYMVGDKFGISVVRVLHLVFLLNFFLYYSTAVSISAHTLKKSFNLKYEAPIAQILTVFIMLIVMLPYRSVDAFNVYQLIMKWSFWVFPVAPIVIYTLGRLKKGDKA
ncbi:MAG: GerAB/ArcD/ProY family transporter [Bacillota bacterium]|nr:GerAB/ArcD/ProY family transporter [Bacillota bacterium]